jgi:hypothetical protein
MNEIEQAEAELAQTPASQEQLDAAVLHDQHARTKDRTFIVRWIVGVYVGSLIVAGFYLSLRTFIDHEYRFKDIWELIKVGVIPILTLVVGYYFGAERR